MASQAQPPESNRPRQQAVRSRFEVGMANAIDVDTAETRTIELKSAVEVFQRKRRIRQAFLKGAVPRQLRISGASRPRSICVERPSRAD